MNLKKQSNRSHRGAVVVTLAVLVLAMIAFTGLAVDLGWITLTYARLQSYTDMAALSGALQLPNQTLARANARAMLIKNDPVSGNALLDSEIVFGNWDLSNRVFAPGTTPINAIQLTGSRDAAHSNALPLFFIPALGQQFADLRAVAIAYAASRVGNPYSAALIGIEEVDVDGNLYIDAYDPSAGPYGGGNAGLPGTIWSGGLMTVAGTTHITGDARPGYGQTEASIQNNAVVDGTIEELTVPIDNYLSPFTIPEPPNAFSNDNATITGDYILNSSLDFLIEPPKSAVIHSGNYYFKDFTVKGNLTIISPAVIRIADEMKTEGDVGQITLNGSAGIEFYVEGTTYLAAQSIVNTSKDPHNLVLYSTGPTITWRGAADYYGYFYSLTALVLIDGQADYYGGAVGRVMNLSGEAGIHTEIGTGFDGPNYKYPVLVD